eukprot:TRINITY_DN33321_c0_g1_i1.p1 TRINITY_DN33321_c0_g1~~TRINITY_DN33321_c0_g1_i1.p1  ORF type:complete len:437 (-),score=55.24 TRINITY_DN33321_c0_g1_i1:29-1339(-)
MMGTAQASEAASTAKSYAPVASVFDDKTFLFRLANGACTRCRRRAFPHIRQPPPISDVRSAHSPPTDGPPPSLQIFPRLSSTQLAALAQLDRCFAAKPETVISEHEREDRRRRHLRFLRATLYDPAKAEQRLRSHAVWWREYGMDNFKQDDEFDEHGPLYVCGDDRWGQPTLVARPCAYTVLSDRNSIRAVRRCVYTLQRAIERMAPGIEKVSLIFDLAGARPAQWDGFFARELVSVMTSRFPDRVDRFVVINNAWWLSAFWKILSAMLDPVTRAKVVFCGKDFRKDVSRFVDSDHPYVQYALKVSSACSQSKNGDYRIGLPPPSPYVPRWREAVVACALDAAAATDGVADAPSKVVDTSPSNAEALIMSSRLGIALCKDANPLSRHARRVLHMSCPSESCWTVIVAKLARLPCACIPKRRVTRAGRTRPNHWPCK